MHGRLGELVLTDFCLITPVPDEEAAVIDVAQRDQKIVSRGEQDGLDTVLMPLQMLDLGVAHGSLDDLGGTLLARLSGLLRRTLHDRGSIAGHCLRHLLSLLVGYLPDGDLRQAEGALTSRQILAIA